MFEYENRYKDSIIAGIDEVGRGPLAGPVVCACVIMPLQEDLIVEGVNDSKKLSEKKREQLYDKILETAIDYTICEISQQEIDDINILNATKKCMINCVSSLSLKPDMVFVDALRLDIPYRQENIIHGDALSYSIACASIVAKVYRDNLMKEYAKDFPLYAFEKHKGYGTKLHIENLKKYGACELHRKTFIKNFVDV